MENNSIFVSQIRYHSKIHLLISILGLIACIVIIAVNFFHLPSLITLLITSIASCISGIIGIKIKDNPSRKETLAYFSIQIFVLAS